MYPLIAQELAEARHSDQLKEAEHRRLISRLRAGQPSMIDRLLEKTGDLLAMTGGQLQERRVSQRIGRLAWLRKIARFRRQRPANTKWRLIMPK